MSPKLLRTIGIDLGGTTISFIDMFSPDNILAEKKVDTPKSRSDLLDILKETLKELASQGAEPPKGIGMAVAGQINHKNKSVVFSPHLPFKEEYPLGKEIEKELGIPVTMDNDANAAAIGEKVYGGAKEMDDFIVLTLGTGIGSGIFSGGKLLRGFLGAGGEAGHMVIDPDGPQCNCGNRGCLETFAGGVGIARMAEKILGEKKSAREISEMAMAGGEKAKTLLREAGSRLGDGLVSLVNIFNPQAIFFTGSIANAPDDYFSPAFDKVRERSFGTSGGSVELKISSLKDKIGVIGAASLPLTGGDC